MFGLIGFGKIYFVQIFVKMLNVLFVIVDVIILIEVGYVGEDVENILFRLIQNVDYDIERVECGIIYIDEIDKIVRKFDNFFIIRDVLGEGVQQVLFKILEGIIVFVLLQGGRKYLYQEFIQIDIINILFICGGVFEGIEKIIEKRIGEKIFGFNVKIESKKEKKIGDILR